MFETFPKNVGRNFSRRETRVDPATQSSYINKFHRAYWAIIFHWRAKNTNVPRKSDVSIRLWDLVDIPNGQLRHASQMSLSGPYRYVVVVDDDDNNLYGETVLRRAISRFCLDAHAQIISVPALRLVTYSLLTRTR